MQRLPFFWTAFGSMLAAGVSALILLDTGLPFYWFSARATDALLRLYPIHTNPDILIVAIDDKSLQALGRFPFDRAVYAKTLDRLKSAGAEVAVLDILFVESTPSDKLLAEAMRRFGKVVLAVNLSPQTLDDEFALLKPLLLPSPPSPAHLVPGITLPPRPLLKACAAIGFASLPKGFLDDDGVCRAMPLVVRLGDGKKAVPSLGLAAIRVWVKQFRLGSDAIFWDGRKVPVMSDWELAIAIPSPSFKGFSFPILSLSQVLDGDFDPEKVRGKLVLIGLTASGLTDRHPTPTNPFALGVELHASVINGLLNGQRLTYALPLWQLVIALLIGAILGYSVSTRSYRFCLALFATVVISAFALPAALLYLFGVLFPPLIIAVSGLFSFIIATGLLMAQKEKAYQRLSLYVARPVADELAQIPEPFQSGERREISVLFSDIRDFTKTSASLPPYEVVTLLGSYFNHMTEIVHLYGGMVNKFLGDGMMVLFGVLPDQEDHVQRAVLCAWQMLEELDNVNWEWERVTGKPLRIGIGINTGTAIIGDIGSHRRKEFTALGATVNLAQRLEQLTKEVGANLLIGEATYSQVAELVVAEPVVGITVRGFEGSLTVYSVKGLTEQGWRRRRQLWVTTPS